MINAPFRKGEVKKMATNNSKKVDYDEYLDMFDSEEEESADYKLAVKFNKTNRRLFSKNRKDNEESVQRSLYRNNDREIRRSQKESFFEKDVQ